MNNIIEKTTEKTSIDLKQIKLNALNKIIKDMDKYIEYEDFIKLMNIKYKFNNK